MKTRKKMVKKKQPLSVLQHFLVLLQFHLQHLQQTVTLPLKKMHGQKRSQKMASSYATSIKRKPVSDVRNAE